MSSDSKFEVVKNCDKRVNQSYLYFFEKDLEEKLKQEGMINNE
jgi:hypothetical protein